MTAGFPSFFPCSNQAFWPDEKDFPECQLVPVQKNCREIYNDCQL